MEIMKTATLFLVLALLHVVVDSKSAYLCKKHRTAEVRSAGGSCQCGVKGASNRIVGGTEATEAEYPWQVGLIQVATGDGENPPPETTTGTPDYYDYYDYYEYNENLDRSYSRPFCGGTIIDKCYVVTAAHCTHNMQASEIKVVIGEHNSTSDVDTNPEDYISVAQIINHENYDNNTLNNDIALLKLATCVNFSRVDVGPACMPKADPMASGIKNATVTGWGAIVSNGEVSDVLLEVTVDLVSRQTCYQKYKENPYREINITDKMLCAFREGKDSCQGDSGGPLVSKNAENLYELIGVVSFGLGCADVYPGVYADVFAFRDWIAQKVKDDSSLVCL